MSGHVCVESERWWQLVRILHQLDTTTASWLTDTRQSAESLTACRASLMREQDTSTTLNQNLTALGSELKSLRATQQQESETVTAAQQADAEQSAAESELGSSLSEASQSLEAASKPGPPMIEMLIAAVVIGVGIGLLIG